LIRPVLEEVCHLLIVVSNCTPGSAHSQAACAIWRNSSRPGSVDDRLATAGGQVPVAVGPRHACMNSSVTRTELLAFWYWIEWMSLPSRSMSKPASRSTRAFSLLLGLAPDEVLDVGVVGVEDDHLGRAPRLAAGLDRAGRGVGAAHEGDRARRGAAALDSSALERILERLTRRRSRP
jgi:hypothetical protein